MIRTLVSADKKAVEEIAEEMKIRRTTEVFLLFSLGSQFDHLIAMAMAKLGVFCLVTDPSKVTAADVIKISPKGIILSGGPVSVYKDPPPFDGKIFDLGIPVLGICLGFQLWAQYKGFKVVKSDKREFGVHELTIHNNSSALFQGCGDRTPVLESHGDRIIYGEGLEVMAETENCPVAAANYEHLLGVQFHPEVSDTECGPQVFDNFCFKICGAKDRFPAKDVAWKKIAELREQIGDRKVLLALSGGSDSSTVAYLLKYALDGRGDQLRAVYIKGIDRPDDERRVWEYFGHQNWIELMVIDATEGFLATLAGIEDPKVKRICMREVYRTVLEEEAKKFGASFIAQGTLYTDISESGLGYDIGAQKAQIKLHHNIGLNFTVSELLPLSDQVKDTGRDIGRAIGVPEILLTSHPFPGPGLVVRISGIITASNLKIARQLDSIFIEELRKAGLYDKVWQAGVRVTREKTTCTKGDGATSGLIVIPWAVTSVNGFTAQAARFPEDFWDRVAQRMTNEVPEVGCVCERKSGKPPATIEFE